MKFNTQQIIALYDEYVQNWHDQDLEHHEKELPYTENGVRKVLIHQHKCNFRLWHIEDEARRTDVDDSYIATQKRTIDGWNQERNDSIEKIDEAFINQWPWIADESELPLNTETPGATFDRLSIASLKIFHMREQAERENVSAEHVDNCHRKLRTLTQQRDDLGYALTCLLEDLHDKKKRLKLYRQFKMYNDPELNPSVYESDSADENQKTIISSN